MKRLAVLALLTAALLPLFAAQASAQNTSFSDPLTGAANPANFSLVSEWAFTASGLNRTSSNSVGPGGPWDRPIVFSVGGGFLQPQQFRASVTVSAVSGDIAFFGYGQGTTDPATDNEPGNAFVFRIHNNFNNHGQIVSMLQADATEMGSGHFAAATNIVSGYPGMVTYVIQRNGNTLLMQAVNGGTVLGAVTYTIPSYSGVMGLTDANTRFFFGSTFANTVFSNFQLTVAPTITSTLNWNGQVGVALSNYSIAGTNSPTSYGASGLPSGLTFNNGVISGTPTVAGTFPVTITASNAGGTGSATLSLVIAPGASSISISDGSQYTYNGLGQGVPTVASRSGSTGGVSYSYTGTGTTVYSSSVAPANAGTYSVTGTVTADANYSSAASNTASFTISPAAATISVPPYSVVYDGNVHGASGSATGVSNANLNGLLSFTGSYTGVPGGTVSWAFSDPAGNYLPASGSATVTITVASPTVSVPGFTVQYDGNSHTSAGSARGVKGEPLAGLDVSATTHTNAGTFADTWTYTDQTGNYASASGQTTDTIKAAPATFTVSPLSFSYNGSAQGPTVTANPSNATFAVSGTGSATNAGNYSLTVNATGNYQGTSGATAWSIAPGSATVTWPAPAGITYGTPLSAAQLNATASVPGSFSYSPDLGAVLSVGTGQTLSVTFTPADTSNYATQTATTTIDVAANTSAPVVTVPANITDVAAGPSGTVETYSASATDALGLPIFSDGFESPAVAAGTYYPVTTVGSAPVTFGAWNFSSTAGVINGANGAWGGTAPYAGNQYIWLQDENFSGTGQGSIESAQPLQLAAGQTYTVWWAQASRTNNGGVLTYAVSINTAAGSTQIFSRTSRQGEAWQYYAASFTATASGPATVQFSTISPGNVDNSIFLDAISVTTTSPVPVALSPASGSTFAVNATTPVTATATNMAGLTGSNSFTVTINPAAVTIQFTTPTYTYDGTGKAATANTGATNLPVTFSYPSVASGLPVNAGSYPVTASVNAGWATGTATGSLTINPATAAISVTGYSGTYDGRPHLASGTATGVNGVDLSADLDLSATAQTNAGPLTNAWSFTDPTGNYAAASGTATNQIGKATAVFTVTGYSVTYDGQTHAATGSGAGVPGETLALDLSSTAHSSARTYQDSWSFAPTNNYYGASGTLTDTIVPAKATVSVTGYSATYDGNSHTATGTATGVLAEDLSAGLTLSGTTRTAAGSGTDGWSFHDANGNYADASGLVSDAIAKANPTVSVAGYSVTYDGAAHIAANSATGVKGEGLSGLDVSKTVHTNAGAYNADAWTFTDSTGNYNNTGGSVNDAISPAAATVVVTGYSVTYDGNSHIATATVTGLGGAALPATDVNLSSSVHTNVISGPDSWSFSDPNYTAQSGVVTDTITKATAVITATAYHVTYDGASHTATAGSVSLVKGGVAAVDLSPTTHTHAGNYSDTLTYTDPSGNYTTATLALNDVIAQATATVHVTAYSVTYDGNAHTATGTVTGLGNAALTGLDLSATTHTLPGNFIDAWTFKDPNGNYQTVTGTADDRIGVTAVVRLPLSVNGIIDGSVQILTAGNDVVNGNGAISGDLMVPGLPTVVQNGHVTYGGTVDESGSASPSNYQVILNGNSAVGHVLRRVDPSPMVTVAAPPVPTGTVNVTFNKNTTGATNWATVNNVTLNGNAPSVTLPAGTYGTVIANGNSTLVLGVAGATTASVYNLQTLTINGNAVVQIVGPVVINALNTVNLSSTIGVKANPGWVAINVAQGGVTLNGNTTLYGNVVAPTAGKGAVVINGNANLYGTVAADSLIVNGNGLLDQTQ